MGEYQPEVLTLLIARGQFCAYKLLRLIIIPEQSRASMADKRFISRPIGGYMDISVNVS